jgi:uncharacterized membrane protein YoaK (UPF0700 family)
MKKSQNISETFSIGILLALVGGFLDAYTYLCRGQVFANAQTGNIVLLSIHAAKGDFRAALFYLYPIFAFVLGILLAEMVKKTFSAHPKLHWRQIIIAVESIILFILAFLPASSFLNALANISISFVCSLQVEAFRLLRGKPYATTMCTGNLRNASEQLFYYLQTRNKENLHSSLQYFGIIFFFILGAAAGAGVSALWNTKALLVPVILLVFVYFLLFREDRTSA